jgi:hypothetical protein
MAITYTGTNGLFTRLGALVYMMDAIRTHQNNLKTLFDNVQGEYSAADRYMIDQLSGNIEQRQAEAGNALLDVQAAAVKTLVEMLWSDAQTSSARTMRAKTIEEALIYLIRDMDATSNSVEGTTVAGGVLGTTGTGNGSLLFLLEAPNVLLGSTNDWPNIRTDLIAAQCVQDAQGGGVMPGSEVFQLSGTAAYDSLDWRFPAGSGVRMNLASACAAVDDGPQYVNVLRNSDLEDWTSNIPDQWTVQSGTAGAEFLQDTTTFWRGASSLKMAVTGNTFRIRQKLSSPDGTLGTIDPDRPYTLCFAAKKDASATGAIRVSIKDGSNNVIGGLTKPITVSSGLTTSWALYSIEIRAPKVLASDLYVVVESTTAIATAAVYIDEVILAEMMPIAPGGQAFAIIAGSTNFVVEDRLLRKFSNTNEGAFVRAFDRLFDMYGLGLSLPSNYLGGETIADTLIA